jgi:hypothetical protein
METGERWTPINTAPTDGTRVLLWTKQWSAAHTGQFYGDKWGTEIGSFKQQPTHWMALPEPPAP